MRNNLSRGLKFLSGLATSSVIPCKGVLLLGCYVRALVLENDAHSDSYGKSNKCMLRPHNDRARVHHSKHTSTQQRYMCIEWPSSLLRTKGFKETFDRGVTERRERVKKRNTGEARQKQCSLVASKQQRRLRGKKSSLLTVLKPSAWCARRAMKQRVVFRPQ